MEPPKLGKKRSFQGRRKIPCVSESVAKQISIAIIKCLQANPKVDQSFLGKTGDDDKDLELYYKKGKMQQIPGSYFWGNIERYLQSQQSLLGMEFYIVTSQFGQNESLGNPHDVFKSILSYYNLSKGNPVYTVNVKSDRNGCR